MKRFLYITFCMYGTIIHGAADEGSKEMPLQISDCFERYEVAAPEALFYAPVFHAQKSQDPFLEDEATEVRFALISGPDEEMVKLAAAGIATYKLKCPSARSSNEGYQKLLNMVLIDVVDNKFDHLESAEGMAIVGFSFRYPDRIPFDIVVPHNRLSDLLRMRYMKKYVWGDVQQQAQVFADYMSWRYPESGHKMPIFVPKK